MKEFEFTCRIVHETEKAFLVDDGSGKEIWIPKAKVLDFVDMPGDAVELTVPEWMAKEKGLA